MSKLPATTALALALVAACSAPAAPTRTASTFVITTELPSGRVEITVAPSYALGSAVTIPVAIVATRGSITGPVAARVLASGINEAGAPAEVLVRELATSPVTVTAVNRRSVTLTWDTRDAKGQLVPADAYSLVLDFRSESVGVPVTAGATLELR